MFEFGFTKKDLVRAIWSFVFGFVGFYILNTTQVVNADDPAAAAAALLTGAAMAGLSALKNLLLKDGSTLKG